MLAPGFFFSGRRRHTIWNCDWSSDVCSSDLYRFEDRGGSAHFASPSAVILKPASLRKTSSIVGERSAISTFKIGRASCREREDIAVVDVWLNIIGSRVQYWAVGMFDGCCA